MISAFGVVHELGKADTTDHKAAHRAERLALRERTKTALHPPPVPLKPAQSSFITAAGYQKPTRRLALQMKSRPDDPYVYRAKPKQAAAMLTADSLGRHYAQHVRGQYQRPTRYTVADRARLFAAGPQKENS